MSNNSSKTITVVLVLLVIVAVIAVIAKKHTTVKAPIEQGAASPVSQSAQQPAVSGDSQQPADEAASQIKASGSSDDSLLKDSASIDAQMKAVSDDQSAAQ